MQIELLLENRVLYANQAKTNKEKGRDDTNPHNFRDDQGRLFRDDQASVPPQKASHWILQ